MPGRCRAGSGFCRVIKRRRKRTHVALRNESVDILRLIHTCISYTRVSRFESSAPPRPRGRRPYQAAVSLPPSHTTGVRRHGRTVAYALPRRFPSDSSNLSPRNRSQIYRQGHRYLPRQRAHPYLRLDGANVLSPPVAGRCLGQDDSRRQSLCRGRPLTRRIRVRDVGKIPA